MRVRMYGTEEEREVDEATGAQLINQSQARMIRAGEPEKATRRTVTKEEPPTIDSETRSLLETAGFTSDTDIARASDEQLLALDGIGPKKLEAIREAIPHAEPEVSEPTPPPAEQAEANEPPRGSR